jgi:hypothetical protein
MIFFSLFHRSPALSPKSVIISDFLVEQGCTEAQGFFFSRPLPAEKVEAIIGQGNHKINFSRQKDES